MKAARVAHRSARRRARTVRIVGDPPDPPGASSPRLILAGASGGEGLQQLVAFIRALPADLPAAVLVVLHRPIERVSHLEEILGRGARLRVQTADQGDRLEPGVCYIGEPGRHLAVGRENLVTLRPDHIYRNRTVDLLFQSAAANDGGRVTGIVFAGSLSDGAKGLAAIARGGGTALVVDPETVVHWGMPASALKEVPDAEVLASPERIAARVVELVTEDLPAEDQGGGAGRRASGGAGPVLGS